jgi:hypothetical protein
VGAAPARGRNPQRIAEANATHVLHRIIEREEDIEASVAALESMVPAGCETSAPPCSMASGILTAYFGNVRVVMGWDVIENRILKTRRPLLPTILMKYLAVPAGILIGFWVILYFTTKPLSAIVAYRR